MSSCLLAACWTSAPYSSPDATVTESQLTGVWSLTASSLDDFRLEGLERYATASAHRLELAPGGRCSARTLFRGSFQGQPVDPNMECRWSLGAMHGDQTVTLQVQVSQRGVAFETYTIGESDGKLILWSYLTDPDARRYAEFRKDER